MARHTEVIDTWDPATFGADLSAVLCDSSELIHHFHEEDRRLMDEHLSSSPYQSLKPNKFYGEYSALQEQVITPLLREYRTRVWHYTRLVDQEVKEIKSRLERSSIDYLQARLKNLVSAGELSRKEAQIVLEESVFHAQKENREGRFWTTNVPLPANDSGVIPLLGSWGGESAYFWLQNEALKIKLARIGRPRIVEIETDLSDDGNSYNVSGTVLTAWARRAGLPVKLASRDVSLKESLENAVVLRVHTKGDDIFDQVATTYPDSTNRLIGN